MKSQHIILPSDKKFGLFFSLIFIFATVYCYFSNVDKLTLSFGIIALFLISVTLIKADLLHPLNKLWMQFGFLLGSFISPIVLGLIFFVIFTPIAVIMRMFGRDELRLQFKKNNSSHWIIREVNTDTESFKNQF